MMEPEQFEDEEYAEQPELLEAIEEFLAKRRNGGTTAMREVDMILINRDKQQQRMRWARLGRILGGTVLVSGSVVGAVQAGALLGQDDGMGWWFAAGALACLVAFVFVLFDWPGRA